MDKPTPPLSRELLRVVHPWVLLVSVLTYALGGGIARYLGTLPNWTLYWVGQSMLLLLIASAYFLREYFETPPLPERQPLGDGPLLLTRIILIQIAAALMTVGAVLTVLLFINKALNPNAFLILGLYFLLSMAYAIPPVRLAYSGYGELVIAVLIANLTPLFAFLLQAGDFHRLLAYLTFPITFLFLAAYLAVSLSTYARDITTGRKNMLIRLGWQRGMVFHNILVLFAFLILGTAAIAGLPWRLTWPGLLALPVGLFQVWQMWSISNGAKARWQLLIITAAATLALTIYFMNLALWTG
jgi:1,4-dihydroxy-2-naphthoate polyprenyltransferase